MRVLKLLTITCAIVAATDVARAGDYSTCVIEYKIMHKAKGDHDDEGPYLKLFEACVASIDDCHNRADALARENARQQDIANEGVEPDLDSISVAQVGLEGDCDRLD